MCYTTKMSGGMSKSIGMQNNRTENCGFDKLLHQNSDMENNPGNIADYILIIIGPISASHPRSKSQYRAAERMDYFRPA